MPLGNLIIPVITWSPEIIHSLLFQTYSWIGSSIMGFCSILVIFLIIFDACIVLLKITGRIFNKINPHNLNKLQKILTYLSIKQYFRRSVLHSLIVVSALLTGYGIYEVTRQCDINYISVPIKGLPEELNDFRIVQLTDLHIAFMTDQNDIQQIVDRVNILSPDIVVVTGDLIDGPAELLKDVLSPFSKFKTKYGSFFVTGNHEHYDYLDKWFVEFSRLGLKLLINSHSVININSQKIFLAGVTDYRADKYDKNYTTDPEGSIKDAPACAVKIMLAHSPISIYEVSKFGFDFQISGHTHGGVYFPVSLIVNLRNFLFKVDNQPFRKGLHKYQNTWIYISSGIGYWGPPLRIGNPAEIPVIILKEDKL